MTGDNVLFYNCYLLGVKNRIWNAPVQNAAVPLPNVMLRVYDLNRVQLSVTHSLMALLIFQVWPRHGNLLVWLHR